METQQITQNNSKTKDLEFIINFLYNELVDSLEKSIDYFGNCGEGQFDNYCRALKKQRSVQYKLNELIEKYQDVHDDNSLNIINVNRYKGK